MPDPKLRHSEPPAGVRYLTVDSDHDGQRIDNFLLNQLKGVPRSRIYQILRTGEVRVNKGRVKPSYRLQEGDSLRLPPVRVAAPPENGAPPRQGQARIEAAVLYEDASLLVLNKPAGMAVHGGSGVSFGVIETLRALRPEARSLELVHRLDRSTSGCLIIAKKRSALRLLHAALREGTVDKQYLALVRGRWRGGRRKVEAALAKNVLRSGERLVEVNEEGKAADTLFEPVAVFAEASLMRVHLGTGRTHQIRVHAAHIEHPLAGDDKYGDADFNARMRGFGLRRLFLHAECLRFAHPDGEQMLTVRAPLDEELRQVLKQLGYNGD